MIGESMPTLVTAQTSRSLPIGEYVIIDSAEGKIIGLAEKSVVSSAAPVSYTHLTLPTILLV